MHATKVCDAVDVGEHDSVLDIACNEVTACIPPVPNSVPSLPLKSRWGLLLMCVKLDLMAHERW